MTIAMPSVQSLLLRMRAKGNGMSTGTGFVAESPLGPVLMTNRHNVTGRHQDTGELLSPTGAVPDELEIIHNRKGHLGEWLGRVEPLFSGGEPLWREHPTLGGTADVVSVIGFPFGLQAGGSLAIWATGFVASEPDIDFSDRPVFLVDSRTRQGQSGSAVISYRGGGMVALEGGNSAVFNGPVWRFHGIYSGRINDQSDIGLVWKASALVELVDSLT